MEWLDGLPLVVWSDQRRGLGRILAAVVDGSSPPQILAEGRSVGGGMLAVGPEGATVLWTQDGLVRGTRFGSPASASAPVMELGENEWLADACSLASGTALALRDGDDYDAPSIELRLVGPDLQLAAAPLAVLEEPDSDRAYVDLAIRCVGSGVVVLNSAVHVTDHVVHHEQWRVRHVAASGDVDFEEVFPGDWAHFAAARRPTVILHEDVRALVRTYGCLP